MNVQCFDLPFDLKPPNLDLTFDLMFDFGLICGRSRGFPVKADAASRPAMNRSSESRGRNSETLSLFPLFFMALYCFNVMSRLVRLAVHGSCGHCFVFGKPESYVSFNGGMDLKKKSNGKELLCSCLYILSDFFLCVTLLLNRNLIGFPDTVICLAFLFLGIAMCLTVHFFRFPGRLFGASVIQAAAYMAAGYGSGSPAPLFFLFLCFVVSFITEAGTFRKWLLVTGTAWGTFVLFALRASSFEFLDASGRASELVYDFVVAAVLTSVALAWYTREVDEGRRLMKKEVDYLSLQSDELEDRSFRDGLTGLPNRRYYDRMLPKLIGANEDFGTPLSLIVIDIDHFKRINDTYGHASGDSVLSALGSLISSCVRGEDTACRYGGEEFVVLMKADAETAADRAEAIRSKAEKLDPAGIHITISCGVAQHEKGSDPFVLADDELYRAKENGRNAVCCRKHNAMKEGLNDADNDK